MAQRRKAFVEHLAEFGRLRTAGLLDEEEFQAAKRQLLRKPLAW